MLHTIRKRLEALVHVVPLTGILSAQGRHQLSACRVVAAFFFSTVECVVDRPGVDAGTPVVMPPVVAEPVVMTADVVLVAPPAAVLPPSVVLEPVVVLPTAPLVLVIVCPTSPEVAVTWPPEVELAVDVKGAPEVVPESPVVGVPIADGNGSEPEELQAAGSTSSVPTKAARKGDSETIRTSDWPPVRQSRGQWGQDQRSLCRPEKCNSRLLFARVRK